MPGRTPREAVKAYVEPLQRNISLISKGVLFANNYDRLEETSVLTLHAPTPLNGRPDLVFAFAQNYRIIKDIRNGPFRVTTAGYMYTVETVDGEEILGYHWHPNGGSPVKYTHLHIGRGALIGRPELDGKAHFPTGRIAFEDFVEFLIDVFQAKPGRQIWQSVTQRTKGLFMKHKSW